MPHVRTYKTWPKASAPFPSTGSCSHPRCCFSPTSTRGADPGLGRTPGRAGTPRDRGRDPLPGRSLHRLLTRQFLPFPPPFLVLVLPRARPRRRGLAVYRGPRALISILPIERKSPTTLSPSSFVWNFSVAFSPGSVGDPPLPPPPLCSGDGPRARCGLAAYPAIEMSHTFFRMNIGMPDSPEPWSFPGG